MNKLKVVIIFLIFQCALSAQMKFQSKLLGEIYQNLSGKIGLSSAAVVLKDTLPDQSYKLIMKLEDFVPGLKVLIRQDSLISHIGLNIFKQDRDSELSYVKKYLERELLIRLYRIKTNKHFVNENEKVIVDADGKSDLFGNRTSILKLLSTELQFNVEADEFGLTAALAGASGKSISVAFPSNINLLSGMDKKELDDAFLYELKTFVDPENKADSFFDGKLKKVQDSVYMGAGKELFNGLGQYRYFKLNGEKPELIFDRKYPVFSFQNLLQEPGIHPAMLKIKHHLYGGKFEIYARPLSAVDSFLRQSAEKYSGFEKEDEGELQFTMLYYDDLLKISHLLVLRVPKKSISKNSVIKFDCDFYPNIRSDNVGDIFRKYFDKNKLFKIKTK